MRSAPSTRSAILIRVGAGAHDVVRLQSPLAAVVNEVDAGIHGVELHARIFWHVVAPFLRIVADEIVGVRDF